MAKDRKRKHRKHALDAALDFEETKALPSSPSTTAVATATSSSAQKRRRTTNNSQVFNGMVVAISTLMTGEDGNNENEKEAAKTKASRDDLLHSYRQVADDCRANGAKVSGQVHKKVHCLLCTSAAIAQSTQRVRKALKNHVPLVDIKWLYQCLEQGRTLSFDGFRLQQSLSLSNADTKTDEDNEKNSKKEKKRDKKAKAKTSNRLSDNDIDHDNEPLPDAGWTDPVEVGCCCVCHETGETATCEWCKDCANNNNYKETKEDVAANPDAGWSEPVEVGCCCLCHETGETANCQWCSDCKG